MRALAIAVGASLVANALAIVWLRPTVASAAGIVVADDADDEADHDSDVSRAEPDPSEVVVELLDEPVIGAASPHVARAKAPIVAMVRATDSAVRTSDSAVRASDSAVRTSDSAVRTSDSAVATSDSSVRAPDTAVGGSDGSDGSVGAPNGTFVRTLDAILARPDASTGGETPDMGPHSKLMTMRGVDLALTTGAVDAILTRPRSPDAGTPKESPDPPDEAAQLRRDITALDKRLMDPAIGKYASADTIEGLRQDLESKRRDLAQMTIHPTGGGHYGAEHRTYTASIEPDGTAHLDDRPNLRLEGLGGSFDVTDWAMRSYGDDPYARAKMRFLDRTRPERIAIGTRFRAEQLEHAPQLMLANIDRVWATIRDLEGRKQALFDLWDDCAETGEPAVVEAGAAARAFVLGVIHARVTYTPADLARLNARRRSTARFEP